MGKLRVELLGKDGNWAPSTRDDRDISRYPYDRCDQERGEEQLPMECVRWQDTPSVGAQIQYRRDFPLPLTPYHVPTPCLSKLQFAICASTNLCFLQLLRTHCKIGAYFQRIASPRSSTEKSLDPLGTRHRQAGALARSKLRGIVWSMENGPPFSALCISLMLLDPWIIRGPHIWLLAGTG